MRTGLNPLQAVLRHLTAALELDGGLLAYRAVQLWPEVVGPAIAVHARAEEVKGDTLMIVTDSPVWSHQLQILAPELVAKLAAAIGPGCPVKQIRFRSGTVWRNPFTRRGPSGTGSAFAETAAATDAGGGGAGPRGAGSRRHIAPLTPGDRRALDEAAATSGDPELGRALQRALRAQISPGSAKDLAPERDSHGAPS